MHELSNDLVGGEAGESVGSEPESGASLKEGVGVEDCVVSCVVAIVIVSPSSLSTIVLSITDRNLPKTCLARNKSVAVRTGHLGLVLIYI